MSTAVLRVPSKAYFIHVDPRFDIVATTVVDSAGNSERSIARKVTDWPLDALLREGFYKRDSELKNRFH